MRLFTALAALVVTLSVVTGATAIGGPPAHSAGGDVGPLTYPALVDVRLVRAEAALARAVEYADTAQPDKAVAELTTARIHLRKAWVSGKYVIDHAPPPVAGDGRVGHTSVAVGAPNATIQDTALAVLSLQHEVASTSVGLIDTAKGTLLSSLSTTIFAALNGRDAAIAYIHSIEPPPVAGDGRAPARTSGAPVGGTWATVMPNAGSQVDDEILQLDGTIAATTSTGAARVLRAAELQAVKTQKTINQYWPTLPADD
jgi:hypothetical protein